MVHGCFWHRHAECPFAYQPKSRVDFWQKKFEGNVARDATAEDRLQKLGWATLTIWECEIKDEKKLAAVLRKFL